MDNVTSVQDLSSQCSTSTLIRQGLVSFGHFILGQPDCFPVLQFFILVDLNGEKHGFGTDKPEGKDMFQGNFVMGKLEGEGKCLTAKGDLHEGNFVAGKLHGKGKITHKTGDVYEGEVQEG